MYSRKPSCQLIARQKSGRKPSYQLIALINGCQGNFRSTACGSVAESIFACLQLPKKLLPHPVRYINQLGETTMYIAKE